MRAAAAECDMRVRVAADVETIGIREDLLVAIRGRIEDHERISRADLHAAQLGLARRGALELHDGVVKRSISSIAP